MDTPVPPDGFELISAGHVRTADLVYNPYAKSWGHPSKTDYSCLGSDVALYYGVARKTAGAANG